MSTLLESKIAQYEDYWYAIKHNGMGYYCGYVFVPDTHPKAHMDFESEINVHGGVTYSNRSRWDDQPSTLPPGIWIGFDCAHLGDAQSPDFQHYRELIRLPNLGEETFKDEHYVFGEIKRIIEQLGPCIEREVDFTLDLPI